MSSNFLLLYQYLAILFVMMFLPFIHIIIAIRGKKDVEPLHINLDYSKNPRYMAIPFEEYFYKTFPKEQLINGAILEDGRVGKVEVLKQESLKNAKHYQMFYLLDDIVFPKRKKIKREIFAQKSIRLSHHSQVRAIKARGDVILGPHCKVQRWIDSDTNIIVGRHSCVNIIYAVGHLVMQPGSKFKRLYAHPVQSSHEIKYSLIRDVPERQELVHSDITDNLLYLTKKRETIANHTHISSSLVSQHHLILGDFVYVQGDIKSNGKLVIGKDCVVNGNIFSEEDIYISRHCFISGNIFSHKNIYICEGTQIGTQKHTKSIVTKGSIKIEKDVTVFSYILADEEGEII